MYDLFNRQFLCGKFDKCPKPVTIQYLHRGPFTSTTAAAAPGAINESSEVFDITKPGQRVKIKGHRQSKTSDDSLLAHRVCVNISRYTCCSKSSDCVAL